MKESKNTRRALAASVGCVALCTAMLVGTTFAWFTDTASTSVNAIKSGTLDVELVDTTGNPLTGELTFAKKSGNVPQSGGVLWEPGARYKTQGFKVQNNGNLSLKYKLEIDKDGVTGDKELLNAIDFTVIYKTGDDGEEVEVDLDKFEGYLDAKNAGPLLDSSDVYYIRGVMKESAGNEYKNMTLTGIKINVIATQYTSEYDSYNNKYDANAQYATKVATADDLAAAIAKGENVVIESSMTLPAALDVKSDVTIYGSGSGKLVAGDGVSRVINVESSSKPVTITLSGVEIESPVDVGEGHDRGISLYGNSDVSIVMDNCTVTANHYALNVAADNQKVNFTVRNSTITGYSAFQTSSPNTTATFENCTITGLNQWPDEDPANGTNGFAVINLEKAAANSSLTFKNCSITANMMSSAYEVFLYMDGDNSVANFDDCTFFVADEEETVQLTEIEDIAGWMFNFNRGSSKVYFNGVETDVLYPGEG